MKVVQVIQQSVSDHGDARWLTSFEHWAGLRGVEILLVDTHDRIELHGIYRLTGRKGEGAVVMAALCRQADHRKQPIALEALWDSPSRVAYFEQFGFKLARGREIEGAGRLMVRRPRRWVFSTLKLPPAPALEAGQQDGPKSDSTFILHQWLIAKRVHLSQ